MYEPNTPLAFRRRDACHLTQQAGHGKIVVGSGQDTEIPILHVANYTSALRSSFQQKNRLGLLTKLCFQRTVVLGVKVHQRYPFAT